MFHFNLHHITLILIGYLSNISCSPLPFGLLSSQVGGNGITFSHVELPNCKIVIIIAKCNCNYCTHPCWWISCKPTFSLSDELLELCLILLEVLDQGLPRPLVDELIADLGEFARQPGHLLVGIATNRHGRSIQRHLELKAWAERVGSELTENENFENW